MAKKAALPISDNRLLAQFPDAVLRRLQPRLELIDLPRDKVLYQPREPMDQAYFPTGSVLSAVSVMEDGNMIEVGTVGSEGMIGHSASAGTFYPCRVIVQIADGALRLPVAALHEESAKSSHLKTLLDNYHAAYMAQMSQSVACNGLHSLLQRCCRWLLLSRDRVGSNDLRLTHEYLAIMLGARRASVTDVLHPLKKDGLIRTHRGLIHICDGAALEQRACECYQVVRDDYHRLLG
jgi:CRP-like cAMP-binding protein